MTPGPRTHHEADRIAERARLQYTPGRVIQTAAISVEEVRAAHRAYIAGERLVAEIALGLGVCATTMKRRFRRLGLEIRPPGRKPILLDDQVVREAHRAYITGERRGADVALGLAVSAEIMRRHFRRLGLEVRPSGGRPRPLNDEAIRRAHRTYVARHASAREHPLAATPGHVARRTLVGYAFSLGSVQAGSPGARGPHGIPG